jgi:hypothetical protein
MTQRAALEGMDKPKIPTLARGQLPPMLDMVPLHRQEASLEPELKITEQLELTSWRASVCMTANC